MKLVLIVDDDADLREVLSLMLRRHGLEVIEAEDGQRALQRMAERRPDLILLDMRMPIMDGAAFCRAMLPRGQRPPILVMTAAADPAERAGEVGAEAWLPKPFVNADLFEKVDQLLR